MDEAEVERWFGAYLADVVALGRGETADVRLMLRYYGVPLILGSDAGCRVLTDEAGVLAAVRQQIEGMVAAGYDRSNELAARTTVLNSSCALRDARFARLRADGSEISRFGATYLVIDTPAGHRISAIIVHAAPAT